MGTQWYSRQKQEQGQKQGQVQGQGQGLSAVSESTARFEPLQQFLQGLSLVLQQR